MTPEEKHHQEVWQTLQDIQEEILVTEKGKPVKYRFANIIGGGAIPAERRRKILRKLQEMKAFTFHRNDKSVRFGGGELFYLNINPAQFKKVYEEYRPKISSEVPEEQFDYSDNALRGEYEKKWEIIKILKSHYIAKENPKILLIWAKSFLVGEVKTMPDAASYFSVFQQAGCFQKYGLAKDGNFYAFLDFNKEKLLETYRTVEKHYKRFAAEYQKTHPPIPQAPFDWTTARPKNVILAQKVIEIILDYFDLRHWNRLTQTGKIPLSKFQSEQIHLEDVSSVLGRIDGIKVTNGVQSQLLRTYLQSTRQITPNGRIYRPEGLPTEAELNAYVFLQISSLDEMRRVQGIIDAMLNKTSDFQTSKEPARSQKEMEVGKLATFADGSIRYGNVILETRSQLKELCRLFMEKHRGLVTLDDIKDRIVDAKKRKTIKWSTISKYVSELHNSLKIHFKKDVIFNQPQEGWYFDPDRN